MTQFETFTASLEAAEAPAEISTDWDNVTGVFRQLTDTLETAVDDPANADTSWIMSLMTDETFQTSAQNVAVYGTQNCDDAVPHGPPARLGAPGVRRVRGGAGPRPPRADR